MGDGPRKLKIIPDYFQASTSAADSHHQGNSSTPTSVVDSHQREDLFTSTTPLLTSTSQLSVESSISFLSLFCSSLGHHCLRTRRKLKPASMMRLFSLRGLPFTGGDDEEKVEISAVELESLRSELTDLEEKEALLKARLEHLDEMLKWARLSGYLHIRSRWAALPGEPPPIDDCEVDDWIPRFVVLQGPCLFFFLSSKDLSPQDSTLLTDIIEVGSLPVIEREGEEKQNCFYILTKYGLRFECSSISKIQIDSWLTVLQEDCSLGLNITLPDNEDSKDKPESCT